jgi:hypothetical protein
LQLRLTKRGVLGSYHLLLLLMKSLRLQQDTLVHEWQKWLLLVLKKLLRLLVQWLLLLLHI